MKLARDVVIVDYLRSPFSRSRPKEPEKDQLNDYTMDEVIGMLWKELIKRNNLDPKVIDEAVVGVARPVLEMWTYGGKLPSFFAELPVEVASQQVDQQCGSSLDALRTGVMAIATGFADVVLCAGMEHMTHIPLGGGNPAVKVSDKLRNDPKYSMYDINFSMNMGFTAQKLQEMVGFTREEMDKWSVRSHQLAAKAQKDGFFKGEILPIEITLPDGSKQMYDYDACVRADTNLETLLQLKPAYKPDGSITAGNASPLNAGATSMLIMSRDKARKLGYKPIASFVSFGVAGVDPTIMGAGPVPASKKALEFAGLKAKDIDFWEINEAFSVVSLYCMRELGVPEARVNVKGGAVAIGHPLGATGLRLVGTLARILKQEGGKYGLATQCCGGGQGVAAIIRKE
ncbi:MAG: acetyl-CoA C-acetyltransferase [Dehalococcoidia bacterium]|nr:acetyl-CoA C-acetyltransferase [Dehalococcoidia bacterium]MDD5495424.1 acetyl-CoA C-acetyltransferase [Dehalococcoidia bacterium]